jgi:sugar/nucleoside kinase (ribokinase family)
MNFFRKNNTKNLDFIALGDMVIDAFIRLNDESRAQVNQKADGSKDIILPFGDKIPFEFAKEVVAVGNSANAAVSAARLGLRTGLIVNIGADENGKKCLAQLEKEGILTDFVQSHPGKPTNYHYVLWYKDERTILIKHELFEYSLPDIGAPKVLYLSSVSENALPFHDILANYLEAKPSVQLVFQPGTYQMKWGTEKLARIYKRTNIFFCNVEEAERILGITSQPRSRAFIESLLDGIRALGPTLPVITDGPNGVYTYTCNGSEIDYNTIIHLDKYPDIAPPYERTGAGDAFASTFAVARTLGLAVPDALKWASINSMNVCQHIGAQEGLQTRTQIEEYLQKAPAGWDIVVL